MNILVIFIALLLAIVIFFLLYCLQYKKLNKQIESFEIKQNQCAENDQDLFYIEIDNEVQACFNYIDELYSSTQVGIEFTLYNFNGKKSYAYVRDFLDNFFNVSMVIIFRDTSLSEPQTIIDTKFLLVELIGTELKVTYNHQDTKPQEKTFANIDEAQRYQLKIIQDVDYKDVNVIFDKYDKFNESEMNTHIFKRAPLHSCKFSSDNDFYIGCNRQKKNYIKAFIGDISFDFDKSEFDKYDIPQITLPSNLECDPLYEEQPLPTLAKEVPTEPALPPFNSLENFVSIDIGNQFKDLKVKYFDSQLEDHLVTLSNSYISQIRNYFRRLSSKEEIFTNVQNILIEKNNGFFDGYDNLRNNEDPNMYYLFSLNNDKNVNILSKFAFLDLEFVKECFTLYKECHIFIYGERVSDVSYFRFLNIKKPRFFIVYKNDTENTYQFEQIKINLNMLYKIQKDYLLFLITKVDSSNSIENYIEFVDSLKTYESLTENHIKSDSIAKIPYNLNIFRLYDSRINFTSITISIFTNTMLKDIFYVKYKSDSEVTICEFVPSGETKFECIQDCNNSDYHNCKESDCKDLCNNCQNSECKWNVVNIERQKMFVPGSIKVKGFSGDGKVKLTWIKPISNYKLEGYFIIVENEVKQNRFDMYVYEGEEEMVEFVISNLENSLPHSFYVFSKNSQGVSEPSNRVTLIPEKNKMLDMENVSKNSFSDSLQNYYKTLDLDDDELVNVDKQIRNMDYLMETNSLKEILVDKIVTSKINNLNVNIF